MYSGSNVGIGVTNPSQKLEVTGNIYATGYVQGNTAYMSDQNGVSSFGSNNGTRSVRVGRDGTSNDIFITGSSGYVGIGTDSPIYKLQIAGSTYVNGGTMFLDSGEYIRWGNSAQGIRGVNDTSLEFVAGSSTRMYVSASGNVGLGTAAPGAKLDIVSTGAGSEGLRVDGTGGGFAFVVKGGSDYTSHMRAGATIGVNYFTTPPSNGLIVEGNVGIGTNSPVNKFVVSNAGASGLEVDPVGGVSSGVLLQAYNRSTSAYMAQSYYALTHTFNVGSGAGTRVLDITSGGNVGIGTSSPTGRLTIAPYNTTNSSSIEFTDTDNAVISSYYSQVFAVDNTNTQSGRQFTFAKGGKGYGTVTKTMMVIDADSGNVGIGVNSPTYNLEVSGSGYISGSLTVAGTITAQKLNVQQITSSVVYSSGSNIFGNSLSNTQTFTGSIQATGSTHYLLGDVGIGTTGPGAPLDVYGSLGSGKSIIRVTNSDTVNYITLGAGIPGISNAGMNFTLDGTSKMVISAGGNVGIGTTSPVYKLDVNGNQGVYGTTFYLNTLNGTAIGIDHSGVNTWRIGVSNINTSTFSIGNDNGGTFAAKYLNITNGGNVGIGTTSPISKLHVADTGESVVTIQDLDGTNQLLSIGHNGGSSYFLSRDNISNGNFSFYTFDGTTISTRMYIAPGGNVGIGTTSPAFKLDVNGDSATRGTEYILQSVNNTTGYLYFDHSGTQVWKQGIFNDNTSTFSIGNGGGFDRLFNITNAGNVGIGTTTPSAKLEVNGGVKATSFTGSFSGSVAAPGSTTQVVFNSGGALAANSGFVYSGSNVGIGTTSPYAPLHVKVTGTPPTSGQQNYFGNVVLQGDSGYYNRLRFDTNGTGSWGVAVNPDRKFVISRLDSGFVGTPDDSNFVIDTSGSVGIGTTNPGYKLDVNGGFRVDGTNGDFIIDSTGNDIYFTRNDANYFYADQANSAISFILGAGYSQSLYLKNNGFVGINTTNPTAKLDVNGNSKFVAGFSSYTTDGLFNADALPGVYVSTPGGSRGTYLGYRDFGGGQYWGRIGVSGSVAWSLGIGNSAGTNFSIGLNNDSSLDYFTVLSGSGNIGIGTTSPSAKLDIAGSTENRYLEVNAISGFAGLSSGSAAMVEFLNAGDGNTLFIKTSNSVRTDAAPLAVWTDNNPRLLVRNDGNIGIGTTSPGLKLDVVSGASGDPVLRLQNTDANGYSGAHLYSSAGTLTGHFGWANGSSSVLSDKMYFGTIVNKPVVFTTNDAEKMRISADGNVGIGTTSPSSKLDISVIPSAAWMNLINGNETAFRLTTYNNGTNNGTATYAFKHGLYYNTTENAAVTFYRGDSSTGGFLTFTTDNGTERMRITNTGNVGIGTTSPTQRLHVSGAIAIEAESTTTKYSTTFSGSLTGNTNIAFVPTGSFKAAFFDYYVASGSTNMRAGTIMAVQNNSTSRYTDTSTGDIGNTSAVDFSTSVLGGNLVLTANISSGTWEIKTSYRAL